MPSISLPAIAIAATVGSGIVGAIGSIQEGQAKASAAKYNSAVALNNAEQERRNAQLTSEAGSQQAAIQGEKTKMAVGDVLTNQAASGLDVNSGSNPLVRESQQLTGYQDALTIRSNATKQAYGYETQATNDTAQSELDKKEASADLVAGDIGAVSTLLGTAGSAGFQYAKWQQSSGQFL